MDILNTGTPTKDFEKVCSKCKTSYPVAFFTRDRQAKSGLRSQCKECSRKKNREWASQNKKPIDDERREYNRRSSLLRLYGISLEDYNLLLDQQQGFCPICECEFETFCVDHNHQTGDIRGLLCNQCNRALGMFGDDVERLERAIRYLRGE